jgi:flagellar P-ring protein precursor FlgI
MAGLLERLFAKITPPLAGLILSFVLIGISPVAAQSRIKDIAKFDGVRENQLIGYGLVVGLNKTGDTVRNSPFLGQSLSDILEVFGFFFVVDFL